MIAWGSPVPSPPLQPGDHQRIEAVLAPYNFVRAFPGSGVLTLADDAQRMALEQQLIALITGELQNRVQFLTSPLIAPGTGIYRGYLISTVWEPINKKVV